MNSRNGGIRYIRWAALVTAALLTAVATIGVAPQARAAAETEKTLGVTHYQQNQSQWCWATAAQMAVMYLRNVQNSQCSYVNHAHNTTTCKNEVGSWGDVEKLVDDYLGGGGNWTSGALTSVTLRSSINAYHPVISYIVWRKRWRALHDDLWVLLPWQ